MFIFVVAIWKSGSNFSDFGDFAGFGSVWAISVKRNDEEMGHDIFQTVTCQNGETQNKKVYVPKVYVLLVSLKGGEVATLTEDAVGELKARLDEIVIKVEASGHGNTSK